MYLNRNIWVIVPAFDEAPRIRRTLETVPAFADRIVVVDDGSRDGTADAARSVADPRIEVLVHETNRGVGSALSTGYRHALDNGCDVAVVIGGDGQMDPDDMEALVRTVIEGRVGYAKGNRLRRWRGWIDMPPARLAGTLVLSLLTIGATGYVRVFDSQCGYTAIARSALARVVPEALYPRYGYPNDLLIRLARCGERVRDVPVRIRYGPGTSKMRLTKVVRPLGGILWRGLAGRFRGPRGWQRRSTLAHPRRS